MKILAGIDEAGLGPVLGPLVTAAAALSVPDSWEPDSPWIELETAFCREWRKSETRAGVADSKILYRAGGTAALELTVGSFHRLVAEQPDADFSVSEAGDGAHPCYSRRLYPFPLYVTTAIIERTAGAMRSALSAAGAAALHLEAAALYEPALNRRYTSGLNKNQALLKETGRRLSGLSEKFPDHQVLAVVDKQGGRNDYLPFLTSVFPGIWIQEITAGAKCSTYRLHRPGNLMEIRFQVRADSVSFATALASLAAKYVRERAMAELNTWFTERFPDIRPTAGYPQDADRWLREVGESGGDADELKLLIRTR